MQRRLNHFMLLFVILAMVVTSAVRTTVVYADDGTTEPPTGESTPPAEEEGTSTNEAPQVEDSVAAPEIPAAEPAIEEPLAAPEEAAPTAEEPATVPEVLEQLPEGTELVVVNEAGEAEPLATTEAAEIVQSGDPRYTVGGTTYYFMPLGGCGVLPNCTESATPIQAAVNALSGAGATPDDGTLYIDAGTYTENVTINGNSWNGGSSTPASLTISGASSATTTLNGSLSIANMNIFTLSGITVTGANSTAASIDVSNNAGTLTLDDVSATNSAGDGGALYGTADITITNSNFNDSTGQGLIVETNGHVTVANSNIMRNGGNGLIVGTEGNIDVDTVTASDNTLTGAYLDSCRYGSLDPGLCAGSGVVTLTGTNVFENNGIGGFGFGLGIDSGGGIAIANVQANGNGLNGTYLMSADDDGTGDVEVTGSSFASNGTGLTVLTDGNITLIDDHASSNNTGVILNTTYGIGTIYIEDSSFGTLGFGNNWTGLHAVSGSDITLLAVEASDNGSNGAYLEAEGNITVSGTFNGNVKSGAPEDPGLFAWSNGGNITLNGSAANNNVYGAGTVLATYGSGTITVNGGQFNGNGTFGVQAYSDEGNITLSNTIASYNQIKGAYLGAYWTGDIIVQNSAFVENGSYGIYAFTGEGNISLDLVTVLGSDGGVGPGADDLTDDGAVLEAGGDVTVNNSTFQYNTDVGLKIISGGQVTLNAVTADANGGNGVEIYSLSTAGPICQGESPINITVNVDGGTFTNNGGYGLMVKPGPQGTLVFLAPSTFGGNGLGDYLLDLSQEFEDCTCPPEPEEPPSKGPLIVDVPTTGGPTVAQDCELYTGTILRLPNHTWVKIGCPFEGFSKLEEVQQENLPGPFGAGINFASAIALGLTDAQGNVILNEGGTVTINFVIPEGSRARGYSILFWDAKANNGAGSWVELPLYEVGTSFPLNPKNPDDHRTILSGVKQVGNVVTVTVNFSGVFALVTR